MKWALIGCSGTVGSRLMESMSFDYLYNSSNISSIISDDPEIIVCAAPSGNRLWVSNNSRADLDNVQEIYNTIKQLKNKKVILLGSVDSIMLADSVYGKNRLRLETLIKETINDYHILRLPTLISHNIKKNILYDLNNNLYLDGINVDSQLQWYDLSWLKSDIDRVIISDIREINLVSDPISNGEIIDLFFAHKKNLIGQNPAPKRIYNITPIIYNKNKIFKSIKKYLL
jgi:hypothetical protein